MLTTVLRGATRYSAHWRPVRASSQADVSGLGMDRKGESRKNCVTKMELLLAGLEIQTDGRMAASQPVHH